MCGSGRGATSAGAGMRPANDLNARVEGVGGARRRDDAASGGTLTVRRFANTATKRDCVVTPCYGRTGGTDASKTIVGLLCAEVQW